MSRERGRNRSQQPGGWGDTVGLFAGIGGAVALTASVYVATHAGHAHAGLPAPPRDPWATLFGVLSGDVAWPSASWWVFGICVLTSGGVALVISTGWRQRGSRRSRVDWSATHLGAGKEITGITAAHAAATATRLHVPAGTSPGLPLGRSVAGRHRLFSTWEDMLILIAGPRVGKSVAFAVPAILAAPGGVLVTSNKRDLVDTTRQVRAAAGPVWVFDPQGIAAEPPDSWWWNPLSYVTNEVRAATLADHFAAGSRAADAKTDAFFEPAGRDLLAGLLLAAALDTRPITDVYRWLTRPSDETPVDILNRHDFPLTADQVAGVIEAPDKQRGGVYGTAQQMASCLTNREVLRWVVDDGTHRQHFDPDQFVASGGTLYSLSREGRGNAGPLVTALTVAVVEAAEAQATHQSGGRLQLPLVGVLDEAANVCRWRDLPDLYSHYGSRGIVLLTILQSWAQGTDVWGRSGMDKLWSASNVAIYAGGVKEEAFLDKLAKLIGTYDKATRSTSVRPSRTLSGSERSTSYQLARERILDVDDLQALPRGRAVVLASGSRPTLIETVPWMDGPHASAVQASLEANNPTPTNPWLATSHSVIHEEHR